MQGAGCGPGFASPGHALKVGLTVDSGRFPARGGDHSPEHHPVAGPLVGGPLLAGRAAGWGAGAGLLALAAARIPPCHEENMITGANINDVYICMCELQAWHEGVGVGCSVLQMHKWNCDVLAAQMLQC